MKVLLDSNFIISCVKRKIDFIDELKNMGFKIAVPREVLQEMKDLKIGFGHDEKSAIEIAMEMIEKGNIEKTTIGKRNVDEGLIQKGKDGFYIATLDVAIKRIVPSKVVINNAKNSLEIERN